MVDLTDVTAPETPLQGTVRPGDFASVAAPAQRTNRAKLRYEKWIRKKNTRHVAWFSLLVDILSIATTTYRTFTSACSSGIV